MFWETGSHHFQDLINWCTLKRVRGPGGYFRFQVTGMIKWGQKSKPQKIPGPKFNPQKSHAKFLSHKNFQKAINDITTNHQTVLNTPKNPYLNQVPPPKSPPKSFDPPCHLKSEVPPGVRRRVNMSPVWISKPIVLHIEEDPLSPLVYYYSIFACPHQSFNPSCVVCHDFICLMSSF